jgi:hypothetical protein
MTFMNMYYDSDKGRSGQALYHLNDIFFSFVSPGTRSHTPLGISSKNTAPTAMFLGQEIP